MTKPAEQDSRTFDQPHTVCHLDDKGRIWDGISYISCVHAKWWNWLVPLPVVREVQCNDMKLTMQLRSWQGLCTIVGNTFRCILMAF